MIDGPSFGKLLPGDEIIRINEEYVEKSPREHVIELVRFSFYCFFTLELLLYLLNYTSTLYKFFLQLSCK